MLKIRTFRIELRSSLVAHDPYCTMKRRNVPNKYLAVAGSDSNGEFDDAALLGGAGAAGQKKRWISVKFLRKVMIVSGGEVGGMGGEGGC